MTFPKFEELGPSPDKSEREEYCHGPLLPPVYSHDANWWRTVNPVKEDGSLLHNTTTKGFKIGNGVNRWSELPYWKAP